MCIPTNNKNNNAPSTAISDSFGEILICPITLELPLEAVMAMDGKVYEKDAIEMHFQTQIQQAQEKAYSDGSDDCDGPIIVTSPLTRQPMETTLLPATQHKNLIETAIQQGILTGELVENWKQRVQTKKTQDDLVRLAKEGDVMAMQQLSHYSMHGLEGFPQDLQEAYYWAQQSHHNGSIMGTAIVGFMLLKGMGVEQSNAPEGIRYLTLAAHNGSAWACCRLGMILADGLYNVARDEKLAIHWLQISLSGITYNEGNVCGCDCDCDWLYDDLTDDGKYKAQLKLNELIVFDCGTSQQ